MIDGDVAVKNELFLNGILKTNRLMNENGGEDAFEITNSIETKMPSKTQKSSESQESEKFER